MTVEKAIKIKFEEDERVVLTKAYAIIGDILENVVNNNADTIFIPNEVKIDINLLRNTKYTLDKLSDYLVPWSVE